MELELLRSWQTEGEEKIPPFLCPSPHDAGMEEAETKLPGGWGLMLEDVGKFSSVGVAVVCQHGNPPTWNIFEENK